jgi:hypothetical protein
MKVQVSLVVEQREIGEGSPGIKCELGHIFPRSDRLPDDTDPSKSPAVRAIK